MAPFKILRKIDWLAALSDLYLPKSSMISLMQATIVIKANGKTPAADV
jgi:hypothetical protein